MAWVALAALVVRARLTVPSLPPAREPAPTAWPGVSVIVPSRDEEEGLEGALRSKLALDYPALTVVLVDDRSTDATGAIADRIAEADPRLSVVHVRELPPGWLGKVNALCRGIEGSTGEWLLLSDADVHFAPDTLKRAVSLCEARGLDYLAATPRFEPSTPLVNVAMSGFLPLVVAAVQADLIESPKSRASVGAGVFALLRRSAYLRSPGLAHLRLEIADDLGLGQLMKHSGARCGVVAASDQLSLTMYRDFARLARGIAKGACAAVQFRLWLLLLLPAAVISLALAPWLALGLAGGSTSLLLLGLLGGLGQLLASIVACRFTRLGAAWGLFAPVGLVLIFGLILATGLQAHLRGEVRWRETAYSIAELRAASRFKLPWQR